MLSKCYSFQVGVKSFSELYLQTLKDASIKTSQSAQYLNVKYNTAVTSKCWCQVAQDATKEGFILIHRSGTF